MTDQENQEAKWSHSKQVYPRSWHLSENLVQNEEESAPNTQSLGCRKLISPKVIQNESIMIAISFQSGCELNVCLPPTLKDSKVAELIRELAR